MVAANGIYKLAVIGTVQGQQHVHTLHFRSTTDPDGLARAEDDWQSNLINLWQGAPMTAYRAIFYTADSPVQQYQVRKVCGSLPLPAGVDEAEAAGSILGTRTGGTQPLAPWLAQVVTIRSALAGRRYRGRNFLGGLDENDVGGAVISVGRTNLVDAYYNALVAAFITPLEVDVEARLFVYSRVQSGVPGTQCQNAGSDARGYQSRTALATMKSRKAGSGI
jgi:hypothetical protein